MSEGKRILRIDDCIDIDVFAITSARITLASDGATPLQCHVAMTSGDVMYISGFKSLMFVQWIDSYIRKGLTIDRMEGKYMIVRHFLHSVTHASYGKADDGTVNTANVRWPHGVQRLFTGPEAREVFEKMSARLVHPRLRADEECRERYESPMTRPMPAAKSAAHPAESEPERPPYASDRQWGQYLAYLYDGGTLRYDDWQEKHRIPGPSRHSTPRDAIAPFMRETERVMQSERDNPLKTDGADPPLSDF